jgi:L-lactate dehydrogenase
VDSTHIHAYVLGEHGDSEVLTWSMAAVGGIPLEDFCKMRDLTMGSEEKGEIDEQVRGAAYHIIAGKGATYYGVGSALARIVEAILRDQRAILTVCTPAPEVAGIQDVTVSLPHLVGGQGVLATFQPSLNPQEQAALNASASLIHNVLVDLDKGTEQ